MKKVKIKYYSNPNKTTHDNQIGSILECSVYNYKLFNEPQTRDEARKIINFFTSCTRPITEKESIFWAFNKYPEYKEQLKLVDLYTGFVIKTQITNQVKRHCKGIELNLD